MTRLCPCYFTADEFFLRGGNADRYKAFSVDRVYGLRRKKKDGPTDSQGAT